MKNPSPDFIRLIRATTLAALVSTSFAAETQTAPAPAAKPATPAAKAPLPPADPTVPAPKTGNATFFTQHESFLKRAKSGPIGVLFLGDSITAGWVKAPDVWKKYYDAWQPANFGIGGDRTEHVLWRMENGELEGISPKVVVLMIGTNNTGGNTAPQIAAGVRKIVTNLRAKLPQTKVLLLAVFPRGPRTEDPKVIADAKTKQEKINAINADIAKLDDGKNIRFLDIGPKFLVNGAIPMDVMPDQLHPNAKGYQIWAESMQPLLEQMMK